MNGLQVWCLKNSGKTLPFEWVPNLEGSVKLTGCTLIGDITANGPVTVSEDSKVTGNITAQSLLCAGEINGDIRISGNTQMDANARVSGSVVTGTISVAAGAVLNGSVEMKGTMEAKS